jgi:4-amino-4-deoxy-L-arabinose transferase-like glycosyltransferase
MLLAIALVGTLLISWRMTPYLEGYYAAAVRSMAMSWRNLFFGSFDPAGTLSLDKLPGSFWIQAVSVRIFGFHAWAIVLPQLIEGVVSILILFKVVCRLCGPAAGLLAAAFLAVAPVNVELNRGNIADSLLIMLLLLAADALAGYVIDHRWYQLPLTGLFVGLAFQAKMLEAWVVLPVFAIVVLLGASGSLKHRATGIVAMGLVALLVSLSWMTVVTAVPSGHRPFVDGSTSNSVYQQVFTYNGVGHVGGQTPNEQLSQTLGLDLVGPSSGGLSRLVRSSTARDWAWALPAALVALVGCLVALRRRERGDPERANVILWGGWLLVMGASFTSLSNFNPYYAAALTPAVAGLLAGGAVLAWRRRDERGTLIAVMIALVMTAGYCLKLLPPAGVGHPRVASGLLVLSITVTLVLLGALLLGVRRRHLWSVAVSGVVLTPLVVPAVASASVAPHGLGPFDSPFESVAAAMGVQQRFAAPDRAKFGLSAIEGTRRGAPWLMATQTAVLAAPYISLTGHEVLPIGGYTGNTPSPTLATLKAMVRVGAFHLVIQVRGARDPRLIWIAHACFPLPTPRTKPSSGTPLVRYYCTPRAASTAPSPVGR